MVKPHPHLVLKAGALLHCIQTEEQGSLPYSMGSPCVTLFWSVYQSLHACSPVQVHAAGAVPDPF